MIQRDEYFPADLILMNSSEQNGLCYVETKNLDGETNMKHKTSWSEMTRFLVDEYKCINLTGKIHFPVPDEMIYQFEGTLSVD